MSIGRRGVLGGGFAALTFGRSAFAQSLNDTVADNSLWQKIRAENQPMKETSVAELANDLQCIRRVPHAVRRNNVVTRLFLTKYKDEVSLLIAAGNGTDSAVFITELKQNGKYEIVVRKNGDEARDTGLMTPNSLIHKAPFGHSLSGNHTANDVLNGVVFAIRNCETGGIFPVPLPYSDAPFTSKHTRQSFAREYNNWLAAGGPK